MPITVTCPGCRKTMQVPDSAAGKTGRCPCGAAVKVPASPPAAVPAAVPAPPPPASSKHRVLGIVAAVILIPLGIFQCWTSLRALFASKSIPWTEAARATEEIVRTRLPNAKLSPIRESDVVQTGPGGTEWKVAVELEIVGGLSSIPTKVLYWFTLRLEDKYWKVVKIEDQLGLIQSLKNGEAR